MTKRTQQSCGVGLLSRGSSNPAEAEAVSVAEGNVCGTGQARRRRSAVVGDPITHEGNTLEPGRARARTGGRKNCARPASGRRGAEAG